ncbi:MAG: S49 family peptidase, partial [Polaromonas sp.]|nr:S49 family peptidase [Polaromonas sp.]
MNDSNRNDPSDNPDYDQNRASAHVRSASVAPESVAERSPLDAGLKPGWERATLEKLAFAALNEQKATRRWKTFVRLAWLAFFVFLVWFVMQRSATTSVSTPHTAVVEIKGEIAAGADASAEFVNAAL